jgi:hypothetical protein
MSRRIKKKYASRLMTIHYAFQVEVTTLKKYLPEDHVAFVQKSSPVDADGKLRYESFVEEVFLR